jgi:hypothetical protein
MAEDRRQAEQTPPAPPIIPPNPAENVELDATPIRQIELDGAADAGGLDASPLRAIEFDEPVDHQLLQQQIEAVETVLDTSSLLGPQPWEVMMQNAKNELGRTGKWTDEQINDVFLPFGAQRTNITPETLGEMWEVAEPVFNEDVGAYSAMIEFLRGNEEDGADVINRYGWSPMRQMAMVLKESSIEGLKGFAKWRRKFSREGAGAIADTLLPTVGVSMGMDLVDMAARMTNQMRINILTWGRDDSGEIYNRLQEKFLPPVTVRSQDGEDAEYTSRMHAKTAIGWNRFKSMVLWGNSSMMRELTDVLGMDEKSAWWADIAQNSEADMVDAARMMPQVHYQMPPHGDPLAMIEAATDPETAAAWLLDPNGPVGLELSDEKREQILARVKEEGDMWPAWAEVHDAGAWGTYQIGMMTALNTGLEVTVDPFLDLGAVPTLAMRTLRKSARKISPGAAADVAREVRQTTDTLDSMFLSVDEHMNEVLVAEQRAAKELADNGVVSEDTASRVINARRAYHVEKATLDRKSGVVLEDPVAPYRQLVDEAEARVQYQIDSTGAASDDAIEALEMAKSRLDEEIQYQAPQAGTGRQIVREKMRAYHRLQAKANDELAQSGTVSQATKKAVAKAKKAADEETSRAIRVRKKGTPAEQKVGVTRQEHDDAVLVLQRSGRRAPEFTPDPNKLELRTRETQPIDSGNDLPLRNRLTGFFLDSLIPSQEFKSIAPFFLPKPGAYDGLPKRAQQLLDELNQAVEAWAVKNKIPKDQARNLPRKFWTTPHKTSNPTKIFDELWENFGEELRPILRRWAPDDEALAARYTKEGKLSSGKGTQEQDWADFDVDTLFPEKIYNLFRENAGSGRKFSDKAYTQEMNPVERAFIEEMEGHAEIDDSLLGPMKAEIARVRKTSEKPKIDGQEFSRLSLQLDNDIRATVRKFWRDHPEEMRQMFKGMLSEEEIGFQVVDDVLVHGPWGEAGRTKFVAQPESRTKSVDELAREQARFRKSELTRQTDWAWRKITEEEMADPITKQRMLFGPDDTEQAGDALNHLVRTGGEGINDVAITPGNALYRWDVAKVIDSHEWSMVDDWTKAEEALGLPGGRKGPTFFAEEISKADAESIGAVQYTIGESALRVLAREQHRLGKALGSARRLGLTETGDIQTLTLQHDRVTKALNDLKAKARTKGDRLDFDESWLPPESTSLRKAGKLEKFIGDAPYYFTKALYPDSYHLSTAAKLSPVFHVHRDPVRWLATHDPKMSERLRTSYAKYEFGVNAETDMIEKALERAGIIKRSKRLDKKHTIDKERSALLYDMLDTPRNSLKWKNLASEAKDNVALVQAHDELRALLDGFADEQGLTGTAKYLEGYMRHVLDPEDFAKGARPPEFQGLRANASVFISHLMDRSVGKAVPASVKEDIGSVLDFYVRAKNKHLHMRPLYRDLQETGVRLSNQYNNNGYSSYTSTLINTLKGKPGFIPDIAGNMAGAPKTARNALRTNPGKVESALQAFTTLLWMTSIPGNLRYGLMQVLAGATTTASRVGLFRTGRGMAKMMTKEGQWIAENLGYKKTVTQLLENNKLNIVADKLAKYTGIEATEAAIRGTTSFAAIDMMLTRYGFDTWEQAVKAGAHHRIMLDALRMTENANHMYGPISRTPWLNRIFGQGLSSSMTQFTLYGLKQTEELASLTKQNPGKLLSYFAISGYLSRMFVQHLGYDVTQWTGLGYVDEQFENGVLAGPMSPAGDMINRWIDVSEAMRTGDPQKVEDAVQIALEGIQTLMPIIVRDAAKMAERLDTGVAYNSRGKKIRNLLMGENPNLIERVAEGLRPDLFGQAEGVAPGVGGDLAPTMMAGPPIRDRIQRDTYNRVRQNNEDMIRRMSNAVDKYIDLLEGGKSSEAEEVWGSITEEFGTGILLGPDPSKVYERKMQARVLSQNLRYLMQNPDQIPFAIEAFTNYGGGLE